MMVFLSITKSFNMRSTASIEFEYIIEIIQKHDAFNIEPLEGIIPFNRDAFVNVTFSPTEFSTAIMTFQMVISQFNSKPITCTFYGSSTPGLSREEVYNTIRKIKPIESLKESNEASWEANDFDPRVFSPLYLSRLKRKNNIQELNKESHFFKEFQDVAGKSLLKISKPLKKAGFLSDKKVDILSGVSNETQIIDLIPSPQLSKPIEYSPMHIFVNFI